MSAADSRPAVMKFGGSVLHGPAGVRAAARLVSGSCGAGRRVVAVVSAAFGQTDLLATAARALAGPDGPDPEALDLLWSTGEHASAALLTFALHACGLDATSLSVHELGLWVDDHEAVQFDSLPLRSALARSSVVVVPGFLATRLGRVATIGRGGSDLTAVTIAVGLNAAECVLVKDVDGVFDSDPAEHPTARRIPALTYDAALRMADAGSRVVQAQALRSARDAALALVVRSVNGPGSRISLHPERNMSDGFLDSNDSCRSACRT